VKSVFDKVLLEVSGIYHQMKHDRRRMGLLPIIRKAVNRNYPRLSSVRFGEMVSEVAAEFGRRGGYARARRRKAVADLPLWRAA
jgi:hypothetical protein